MILRSKTLSMVILTGVVFVALFGFLSIGTMEHGNTHDCLFVFAGGALCAPFQNKAAVAMHYLDMLGWLSTSLASFDILALVFSSLFVLVLFAILSLFLPAPPERHSFFTQAIERFSKEKHELLRWLSFHNKRDPHVFARVQIFS